MKLKDCLCKDLKCDYCPYKSKKLIKVCLGFKLNEPIKTPFNKIPSILREKILQDFEIEITEKLLDEERRGYK